MTYAYCEVKVVQGGGVEGEGLRAFLGSIWLGLGSRARPRPRPRAKARA